MEGIDRASYQDSEWKRLHQQLEQQFGEGLTVDGIIFLIGVQELGKGYIKLKKDQKLEVMHIAVCRLLEPYGYYKFEGVDTEGWPHYSRAGKLPRLGPAEQEQLMKEAILAYFRGEE